VCQLACVEVTHFPELLVTPSMHGGRGIGQSQNDVKEDEDEDEEEEEEESAALWHLLRDVCKSDGLVVAGWRLQHYTDMVHLAIAGLNARHDVYRACLLCTNNDAPNRIMPVVLKKYILQSDYTTSRSSSSSRNSRTMDRLLRETCLLHLMKHPNIAKIVRMGSVVRSVCIGVKCLLCE